VADLTNVFAVKVMFMIFEKAKTFSSVYLRVLPPCTSVVFFIFFIFLSSFLYPQTAERIERLLATNAVSYEDAAALILEAADLRVTVDANVSAAEAFSFAAEQGWLPARARGSDNARLDGVSALIMRSFNMRGGLFYSLTKSPHYAYRELVYRNIIQGLSDPRMAVSGVLLLFMVNRVLALEEANQL